MWFRYKIFGFGVLIMALGALFHSPAAASADLHLRYAAKWGGLHVADFTLSLVHTGGTYENRFHLETRGLARYFSNVGVKAKSQGRIVAPPPLNNDEVQGLTYLSDHYRTEYTNHKHFRWVDIAFPAPPEPAQAMTGTEPVPGMEDKWNPDDKGPEEIDRVEAAQRIGVNDPITLIAQMISVVRTHLEGGPKHGVVKGFDGRRRFDMHITYLGPMERTVGDTRHMTYRVRIDPKPVAGFKERHKKIWNEAAYDFYLSRDGKFVPLQIVPVKRGPVLTLVRECPSDCEIKAVEEN